MKAACYCGWTQVKRNSCNAVLLTVKDTQSWFVSYIVLQTNLSIIMFFIKQNEV